MGHAVLHCEKIDDVLPFYQDILGFQLSDYFTKPFAAYFFHLNPRHHSVAFIETGKNGIHHLMVETCYLDDVGQAYDLAQCKPEMIATTFGRHFNDQVHVVLFVVAVEVHVRIRLGRPHRSTSTTGRRAIVTEGPSLWGHERYWLTPEQRDVARELRIDNAEAGLSHSAQRDGRQLPACARRLPVVGRDRPCPQDWLIASEATIERQRPTAGAHDQRRAPMEWPDGELTRIPLLDLPGAGNLRAGAEAHL